MRKSLAAAAILILSLTAGCGTDQPTPGNARSSGVDLKVLEQARGEGSAFLHTSIADRGADVEVALTGTIDGVSKGGAWITKNEYDANAARIQFAVVRVKIDRVFKADGVRIDNGIAFLNLTRGGEIVTPDGKPITGSGEGVTVVPVQKLQAALPVGTRVVVMTDRLQPPTQGRTESFLAGVEPGRPLLAGNHPQAFSLEDENGSMSGWVDQAGKDLSYDEVVAQLASTFSPAP